MKFLRATVWLLITTSALHAQEGHGVTPADIQRGAQIYLTKCARCHGENGDGIANVSLFSNKFRRAQTDADLTNILRKGIPGTAMPSGNYADNEALGIVAYLRSMATAPRTVGNSANTGDATRGKTIFEGKGQCLTCHRVGETGGYTGPDLTAIGGARRPSDLEQSLTDPDFEIRDANRPVRAVAKDGAVIQGTLLNYDTYSLQLIDTKGKLRALQLDKLREYEFLKTSPMPGYKDKLTAQELADIVSYLIGLKGTNQ
jgi:putative heme-binding domain-containing protein